jgi:hypothetical protein
MSEDPLPLPEHESPVRRLISDAKRLAFRPLHSLEEAKAFDDGTVILEGDYGGQIYLTCPAHLVRCSPAVLRQLLLDIDAKCWACNEGEGAGIYFERKPQGSGVWGGMGGGAITEGLWLHKEVEGFSIRPQVEAVLAGQQDRLVWGS